MEAVPLSMPPLDAAYSYVMAKLGPIMVRETARTLQRSRHLFQTLMESVKRDSLARVRACVYGQRCWSVPGA